jgi:fructosamine-3-kinase
MQIKKILKQCFKSDDYLVKELTDHGSSKVYKITFRYHGSYILRLSKNDNTIRNNVIALKLLKKQKNIPKIISFGKIGNTFYSIETFLKGKKLKPTRKNLDLMLKSIKKIHNIRSTRSGDLSRPSHYYKDYILNQCIKYKEKLKKKIKDHQKYFDIIENNFPRYKPRYSLLHGDFSFTNALYDKRKVNFFDFEDSFYGEKEYDIAMLYYMELLPEKDLIYIFPKYGFNKKKILFYALCIGIRKVAKAKKAKLNKRIKKLDLVYDHLVKL